MRGITIRSWMLVAIAGLALPVAGQVTRSRAGTTTTRIAPAKTPYTAEFKTTNVQTLADGTTITHESTEVRAVDSQGRSMTSTTTSASADHAPITQTSVFDPVARTLTRWASPGKRATVRPTGEGHGCSPIATEADSGTSRPLPTPHERPRVEQLGTASVQGIEAHGTQTTTTIPAGAVGNDEPLVRTNETWTALTVGLKGLVVREIVDDPRSGKWTRELTNIDQSEPDPAVFQPPAGYQIANVNTSEGCPTAEVVQTK